MGWHLLSHPLYGNIQPSRQPYRSLVLGLPWERNGVDTESLSLLEKAIELFRPSGNGERTPVDTGHLEDFALLDVCLVRECMEEHGLLNG
jgi:hypothetical protein